MREECCKFLLSSPSGPKGLFLDCTVGGGGHTRALLESGGRVIGLDQDPEAIAETSGKLHQYIESGHLELIQTNFQDLVSAIQCSRLAKEFGGRCDGVLMDLGISSHQIDEPERGFAFKSDGPLDMRMKRHTNNKSDGLFSKDGEHLSSTFTAAKICNEFHEEDIADILYYYGEENRLLSFEIFCS